MPRAVRRRAFTKAHEPTTGMLVDVLRAAAPKQLRRYACTRVRAPGLRGRSRTFLPPALSALQAGGLRGVPAARCALLVLGHVLFTVLSRLAGRVVLSTNDKTRV